MIYLSKTQPHLFMKELLRGPQFETGKIIISPKAKRYLSEADIRMGLFRHVREDVGEPPFNYIKERPYSLQEREPIVSIYLSSKGLAFEVITNERRTRTTIRMAKVS